MSHVRSEPKHYLYTDAALDRFQQNLRDALLTEESPQARPYLRALVHRIIVTGTQVEISARPYEALRLMAGGRRENAALLTSAAFSPTSVCDWLPIRSLGPTCSPDGRSRDLWMDLRRNRCYPDSLGIGSPDIARELRQKPQHDTRHIQR